MSADAVVSRQLVFHRACVAGTSRPGTGTAPITALQLAYWGVLNGSTTLAKAEAGRGAVLEAGGWTMSLRVCGGGTAGGCGG